MVNKIDPVARLILLLVAADFTNSEIVDLVDAVRDARPSELLKRVRAIRRAIGTSGQGDHSTEVNFPTAADMGNPSTGWPLDKRGNVSNDSATSEISQEVASGLERLLVNEAGLTKVRASELLANYLVERYPHRPIAPYNPKDGFTRWIKQVSRMFNPSEIMHAAAVIRNSRVHGDGDDWIRKS